MSIIVYHQDVISVHAAYSIGIYVAAPDIAQMHDKIHYAACTEITP
jgi:hypothetical protein